MRGFITTLIAIFILIANCYSKDIIIKVNGLVDYNYEPVANANIKLSVGGTIMEESKSTDAGSFSFILQPGKTYIITVIKEGFVAKMLQFDTHMPDDIGGEWVIEFAVGLFKPCPGTNLSILSKPVSKVVFNDSEKGFYPDEGYAQQVSRKFEEAELNNRDCWIEKYDQLINDGDDAYSDMKYSQAKSMFQEALEIFPDERYPTRQLEKIEEKLKEMEANDKLYAEAIQNADEKALAKEFIPAITLYKKALIFKPGDAYAEQQINTIQNKIEQQEQAQAAESLANQEQARQQEQRLDELINSGEAYMVEGDYNAARKAFSEALSLQPGNGYLESRVDKAESALAQQKEQLAQQEQLLADKQALEKQKDEKFNAAMAKADNLFNIKNYKEALIAYNQAVSIKPASETAQMKRAEVQEIISRNKALMAEKKKQREAYDMFIKQADALFANQEYTNARIAYQQAADIDAQNTYPPLQIKKIDDILADKKAAKAEERALEQEFDKLLTQGEQYLKENKAAEAVRNFKNALSIKNNDGYTLALLTKAEKMLEEQNKLADIEQQRKSNQAEYQQAVNNGDNLLTLKEYNEAISFYNQAISLKPGDEYAISQKSKAENLIQEMKLQSEYQGVITSADAMLKNEDYTTAKNLYANALKIKSNDPYAMAKINEINSILENRQKAAMMKEQNEKKFKQLIAEADNKMSAKEYQLALSLYDNALLINPEADYPKQQKEFINRELAKRTQEKAREQQFNAFLSAGEQHLEGENASDAIKSFEQALSIRNADGYTLALLAKAKKMLEDQKELASLEKEREAKLAEYQKAVDNGDNLLALKEYNEAVSFYNQALRIKPGDEYANGQKNKALNLIEQDKKLSEYQGIITSADAMFKSRNYPTAKDLYANALKIKSNDPYAKDKINEINTILENNRQYNELITKADANMSAQQYNEALAIYEEALSIKPEEQYPANQKMKIQDQLSLLAKNAAYQEKINDATKAYKASEYLKAKQLYTEAIEIKPGDEFAKSKIQEINTLLARLKQDEAEKNALAAEKARKQREYQSLIAQADKKYKDAYYQEAKNLYRDALSIKEYEPYPIARIKKIDETLALLGRGNQSETKKQGAPDNEGRKSSELIEIKFASNKELEDYLEKLKLDYPPGVTQEVYKNAKSTTNRFVIIRADEVFEIREVKHSWGGIDYFRNGKPITMGYFRQQTEVREGEYFKKINK